MPTEPFAGAQTALGRAIRAYRLRQGITQVQLGRVVSRSGKYVSELEAGKVRLSQADLDAIAAALSVTVDQLQSEAAQLAAGTATLNRRVREPSPTGLSVLMHGQLIASLDRGGWLAGSRFWTAARDEFPEETDVALVEKISELAETKRVEFRYVYPLSRLTSAERERIAGRQGTFEAIPEALREALRLSRRFQKVLAKKPSAAIGHALSDDFSYFAPPIALLWVETVEASWSEVMPLVYCYTSARTFENPNAKSPFLYHLPRDQGTRFLKELSRYLRPETA
jgi:transcriptional regulator with XRE-family HTH domain